MSALRRLPTLITATVLAAGPVALSATPATAGPGSPSPAPPTSSPAAPSNGPAAALPCPIAKVPRQPGQPVPRIPRQPTPPQHDPAAPVIGGAALGSTGLVVPPGSPRLPGNLTARAWTIADLDTGAVLAACAPHAYHPPASTQKLLLAAVALPKLDPRQVIRVTPADLNFEPGSSAVGLVRNGRYQIGTLWLGLLLNSGNDAALALARLAGGPAGVPGTLDAMNAEARRLGAFDTHAVTPSGLDGPGQWTSAYDLALIARACFDRPDFRRYTGSRTAQLPAQPKYAGFQIQNDNQLLWNYPGAIGGKTGFTDLARHTYVGAATRNGRRLVVTLLDAEAAPARTWQQAAALLSWAFALPGTAAPVGRLVTPEELAARHTVTTPATPRPVAAGPARHGRTVAVAALATTTGLAAAAGFVAIGIRRRNGGRRRDDRRPAPGS